MRTKTRKNNNPELLTRKITDLLKQGNTREDILKIMMLEKFDQSISRRLLHLPKEIIPIYNHKPPGLDNAKRLGDYRAYIYTIHNFLTPEECQEIIVKCKDKFSPSPILLNKTNPDYKHRTSKTYDILKADFLENVEKKIKAFMGIDLKYSEPLQVQYYEVGNQFKSHWDWFIKGTPDWDAFAGKKNGQRTWTVTIYLNEVEEGGTTDFVKLGLRVKPITGKAVIWNNLYPNGDGNNDTMHAGTPVIKGNKYIITKWFRDILQQKFYK